MKKSICKMMAIIIFCQLLFLALSASETKAETRVTFTFAAGGIACGVYFFIQLTLRSSMAVQLYKSDATALINHGTAGWQINYPSLSLGNRESFHIPAEQSPETVHMEVLRLIF